MTPYGQSSRHSKLSSLSLRQCNSCAASELLSERAHALAQLIRASIANHTGNALLPMPPRPTIYAYGMVTLSQQASLLSQLPQLVPGDGALSDLPLPMEEYGQQCAPTRLRPARLIFRPAHNTCSASCCTEAARIHGGAADRCT